MLRLRLVVLSDFTTSQPSLVRSEPRLVLILSLISWESQTAEFTWNLDKNWSRERREEIFLNSHLMSTAVSEWEVVRALIGICPVNLADPRSGGVTLTLSLPG